MLKLIGLEWKKNNIGKYIRNAAILAAVLCFFMCIVAIDKSPEENVLISEFIEVMGNLSYLVFASVMLSSFIVTGYKNKTVQLMFLYPIKRQKILISQMIAAWLVSFVMLLLTKLFLYGSLIIFSKFLPLTCTIDFDMTGAGFYIQVLVTSAVIATISFIALFVGMKLKSPKATIISSFPLVLLTQGTMGSFTLADNVGLHITLTLISLFFAFLSICGLETKDLM